MTEIVSSTERGLEAALVEVFNGGLDGEAGWDVVADAVQDVAGPGAPSILAASAFESAGVPSPDRGVVVLMSDGSQYRVTIVRSA